MYQNIVNGKMTKKILMLYDFFSEHGGVERIMSFQARTLKKADYDVSFAFAYVDDELRKKRLPAFKVFEYSKLPIKNETLQICSSILKVNSIEKFKKFDLVICHSFPASYLALRLKKKFNIPYILHLHHPPQFLYSADLDWAKSSFKRKFSFVLGKIFKKPLKKFDFYCVKNADYYFIECKSVQRLLHGIKGQVLYPTVNPKFKITNSKIDELKRFGINKPFILGSGRIVPQKRFDFLVKAFSKLKNKKKLQLVLVGKYNEKTKKNLEKLAYSKGIELLILGPVDIQDLIKLYNLAKVTILTCPKEWFGIVPIESMACGCPVVAWKDNFGPEETILPGLNGYLAKPYNTKDMARKISKSISKKWNKNKIAKSVDKFSEKEQGKILLETIKNLFR